MNGARVAVTTASRPTATTLSRAAALAQWLGVPVTPREGNLAALCQQQGVRGVVVVTAERVIYTEPFTGLNYFYHPAMAKVRLNTQRRGRRDILLEAMDVQPGDQVLDCTLGRASDAIVVSTAVGPTGRVVGLEASPILAAMTRDAIMNYVDPSRALTAALRRIECLQVDYNVFLAETAAAAFDVVYFDPLFDEPVAASLDMAPLRALADSSPLRSKAVVEARRVARRCVVIKQRRNSQLWQEITVDRVVYSRHSRVEYGLIEVKSDNT